MTDLDTDTPVILCLSGLDPSGGAGLQADIETLASIGCHCAPVATMLTAQDSEDIKNTLAVDPSFIIEQANSVLEDMKVKAIKIGLLGALPTVSAIHEVLKQHPEIPVIWDPVITSGGGTPLLEREIIDTATSLLMPLTHILTPNSSEARVLSAQTDSLDTCAHQLMEMGCEYVLITGTHENTPRVENRLWGNGRALLSCHWNRLPHHYHGSGCTLAAAIAGYIGQGLDPLSATREAQAFTWKALHAAKRLGHGQHLPYRLHWSQPNQSEQAEQPRTQPTTSSVH